MNEFQIRAILDDFLIGQQEAMKAFTVAISRVVDRDQLSEELRLQVTSFAGAKANPVRDALLHAAWEAVRHPLPPDRG